MKGCKLSSDRAFRVHRERLSRTGYGLLRKESNRRKAESKVSRARLASEESFHAETSHKERARMPLSKHFPSLTRTLLSHRSGEWAQERNSVPPLPFEKPMPRSSGLQGWLLRQPKRAQGQADEWTRRDSAVFLLLLIAMIVLGLATIWGCYPLRGVC